MVRELYFSIVDSLRIVRHRNYFSKRQFKHNTQKNELRILGNGNSLNHEDLFKDERNVDYMVVNRHILSDSYVKIKPLYYVLADPFFFTNSSGIEILKLINDLTLWKMYLCINVSMHEKKKFKSLITNQHISLVFYNSSCFRGFMFMRNFLYSQQLAMPCVQNVLVASIMLGLQCQYRKIELYGVEHNWTQNLFVGEDNIVYLRNPHFFDKKNVEAQPIKDIQLTESYPLYLILSQYARMFQSYNEIAHYVQEKKIRTEIVNMCKGSFIDAFKRG